MNGAVRPVAESGGPSRRQTPTRVPQRPNTSQDSDQSSSDNGMSIGT